MMSDKTRKELIAEKSALKKAKKAAAAKKAKQKKALTTAIITVIAVGIIGISIFIITKPSDRRVFSNENYTVSLQGDATFKADLCGYSLEGHYVENNPSEEDGSTTIAFTANGETLDGTIVSNTLIIPDEWDDNHGHGNTLWLR